MRLASSVLLLAVAASAHTQTLLPTAEPAFCSPDVFLAHEVTEAGADGVQRLHSYRLGAVVLAGMAIGYSEASAVARLAAAHGATSEERFCTWYVNDGNAEAERLFRHVYLPNPAFLSPDKAANIFGTRLGPYFTEERGSVWWCIEERGFVAVGCNGQKHRGPTAFGMLLASLGCSPEHAAEIVNHVWGLNVVPAASRLAAIRRAYDLGALQPALRSRLQQRLSESPSSAPRPATSPEANK